MKKPRVGYSLRRKKRAISYRLLTQREEVSVDGLEQKKYGRNSTRNLNSNENQLTEWSRQAAEKRKHSTQDTGCFSRLLAVFL